jgi:hypothetical protein
LSGKADLLHVDKSSANLGQDYAARSLESREECLNQIKFTVSPEAVLGRNLIFMDDVRITGATERRVEQVLLPMQPNCLVIAHVAVFNIDQALNDPSVESRLNTTLVKGVNDILELVEANRFELGSRALMMILRDPKELDACVSRFPVHWLARFLEAADIIGEAFVAEYKAGLAIVKKAIDVRKGPYISHK